MDEHAAFWNRRRQRGQVFQSGHRYSISSARPRDIAEALLVPEAGVRVANAQARDRRPDENVRTLEGHGWRSATWARVASAAREAVELLAHQ